jgi:small subunit ribosomal protein S24e
MELEIIKEKTNPMLKRREVSLRIKNKRTPSRIEVKNKLAALANSRPELIIIERLNTVFGKQEVIGTASIYESEERLKQLAHKHLIARDAPKVSEEQKAAEGAKEGAVPPEKAPEAKPEPAEKEAEAEARTEKKKPEEK